VMTEPAMTNCTLVLPDPGFLATLHDLCRASGTLLALDETHTWQLAYGGLVREMGLSADFVTLGKGLGSGVPLGAYGMTKGIADYLEGHLNDATDAPGLALGGTTYGSALGLAAASAMLDEVATPAAYARIAVLGTRLADGLEALFAARGLPWRSFRYGPRAGFCLTPDLPRTLDDALPSLDNAFSDARRAFMANRGVWEAIVSAGPQVGFAHVPEDIDIYLTVAADFLSTVLDA